LCQKYQRSFEKEEKYNQHVESCIYEKTIVELPTKRKNTRHYISNGAEQWHPYSVSLDFECLLKKIKNTKIKNTIYRVIKKDCLSWQYN
jgi:CRISPR/Cas system-associated endoribonuclease Cas2